MTEKSASEILLGAAEILETRGRCQGEDEDEQGRVCASQALWLASDKTMFLDNPGYKALAKELTGSDDDYHDGEISTWNDEEDSDEIVIKTLREVAEAVS